MNENQTNKITFCDQDCIFLSVNEEMQNIFINKEKRLLDHECKILGINNYQKLFHKNYHPNLIVADYCKIINKVSALKFKANCRYCDALLKDNNKPFNLFHYNFFLMGNKYLCWFCGKQFICDADVIYNWSSGKE